MRWHRTSRKAQANSWALAGLAARRRCACLEQGQWLQALLASPRRRPQLHDARRTHLPANAPRRAPREKFHIFTRRHTPPRITLPHASH